MPSALRICWVNFNGPIFGGSVSFSAWASRIACNLHLTNSVGHKAKQDQKAAKDPESPFSNADKFSTGFPEILATNFWHKELAANRIEFSAILAISAGLVPAYKPRTIPSLVQVSLNKKEIFSPFFAKFMMFLMIFLTYVVSAMKKKIFDNVVLKISYLKHFPTEGYKCGKVCIFTFSVSIGWPT